MSDKKQSNNEIEALDWLQKNGNTGALASNRFNDTQDAIEFVVKLYSGGAKNVIIPLDSIIDDELEMQCGGPYTDSLIVFLPDDKTKREIIISIYNEESNFSIDDTGQESLYFWWD